MVHFDNLGPVQNQAGRDIKIGTSLTTSRRLYAANARLELQNIYHAHNPDRGGKRTSEVAAKRYTDL